MRANTRAYLSSLLVSAGRKDLSVFRTNLADLAVARKGTLAKSLGFVSLIRAPSGLQFDGYFGTVDLNLSKAKNERVLLSQLRLSHLLNVDDLHKDIIVESAQLDRSFDAFFSSVRIKLDELAAGATVNGLAVSQRSDVFVGPELAN